jgi:CRP-like cAMP-binding protein
VVADEGGLIQSVFFPLQGIISLTVAMEDGSSAETATVGLEGFVGFGAILGRGRACARNIVQVSGQASRIETAAFNAAVAELPRFRQLVFLYVGAFMAQVMRSVACGTLHSVEERAARWLLTIHDRAGRDEFDLTQEFLAEMLGVRRASVNLVSKQLQEVGLIAYRRGRIKVLDRHGLEEVARECYGATQRVLEEIYLPP